MAIPVLSGIGDAFNWYERNVSDPISGSIYLGLNDAKMGLGLGDQGSQYLSSLGNGLPGSHPSEALNFGFQDNPLGRFGFQTVTDPLNLLGTGVVPGAAHGLAALTHVTALPGVAHGLGALSFLDKAPGAMTNAAMGTAGDQLGKTVLPFLGEHVAPRVAGFGDAHPAIKDVWQGTNLAVKELNHLNPAYFLRNLFDDASRQGLSGDAASAGGMMSDSARAAKNYLTGGPEVVSDNTRDFIGNFGGELPQSIHDTGVSTVGPQSIFRRWQSKQAIYDSWGNVDHYEPAIRGNKDRFLDVIARPGEFGKGLENAQEVAARSNVWGNKALEYLDPATREMSSWVDRHGVPDLATDLVDRQGMVSPSEVRERLIDAGVSDSQATKAAEQWWQKAEDVRDPASAELNRVQLNYSGSPGKDLISSMQQRFPGSTFDKSMFDIRNGDIKDRYSILGATGGDVDATDYLMEHLPAARGDQFLRDLAANTFGGYKFSTQALPYTIGQFGEHPGLLNTASQYYRDSDIYNAQHGLSGAHGMMPLFHNPLNGDLVSGNPLGISSMGELVGAMTDHNDNENLAQTVGNFQLGLNPLIKLGLQVTGNNGNNQMPDITSASKIPSGLLSLATGRPVDIEDPLKNAVGGLEQAITGRETFPYQDYLTRRRLADMTGDGNKWNATHTSGPAYDAAVTDTAHRMGADDLLRALMPMDMKMTPPEGERVGRNQYASQLESYLGQGRLAAANPSAHAYDLADPLEERIALINQLPHDELVALLHDPRALELIQQQGVSRLHGNSPLAVG